MSQTRHTGYGVGDPKITLAPNPIVANRDPSNVNDLNYEIGTLWINKPANTVWVFFGGNAITPWFPIADESGTFQNLTVTGNASITGNTVMGGTLGVAGLSTLATILTGIIQAQTSMVTVNLTASGVTTLEQTDINNTLTVTPSGAENGIVVSGVGTTGVCLTLTAQNITDDAILIGQGGIQVAPTTVAAGASPRVCNNRFGQVTFSGVNIAAGDVQTFVVTNSVIAGASTVVLYSLVGNTTGSALSIQSVTNSAGSSSVVVSNGSGVETSTADLTLVFWVLS